MVEALDWIDDRSEDVYLDTSSVNVDVDISNGMMVFWPVDVPCDGESSRKKIYDAIARPESQETT